MSCDIRRRLVKGKSNLKTADQRRLCLWLEKDLEKKGAMKAAGQRREWLMLLQEGSWEDWVAPKWLVRQGCVFCCKRKAHERKDFVAARWWLSIARLETSFTIFILLFIRDGIPFCSKKEALMNESFSAGRWQMSITHRYASYWDAPFTHSNTRNKYVSVTCLQKCDQNEMHILRQAIEMNGLHTEIHAIETSDAHTVISRITDHWLTTDLYFSSTILVI